MRRENWLSLLNRLAQLTEERGGGWQTADLPGVYVLSEPSGSIVVHVPGTDPSGLFEYTVEVRDPDGQVRAELSIAEPPLAADPASTIDVVPLLDRVRRLVTAIEEGHGAAESLAEAIVAEAERANR